MEKHIKKCFKCPQDLKKVLQTSTVTVVKKLFQKKPSYEPLLIEVDDKSAVPNTSSAFEPKSNSSSDVLQRSQPISTSSPKGKGPRTPSFFDHMDLQTNEMLNQSLAKAIFVSGSPLPMVDHPLWIDFLNKIRPSFKLPSRYRLSSSLLDAQYTEMQE
ncbi:uncharacterized protein LOC120352694 [Nilaparvata lugens]|uniref:uncharacterized protein LOC120352694 n=1 Tax=Nilaparvata lugens TaxID=108931 RepID=UPI00193E6B2F|nr:uncharacterized protein LOC120352694 [Nilaparvata lugens]